MKGLNIKQIAREAGVSTQTVSRVLNDRPDVAPETRQRIKDLIKQLGYEPSHIARSLTRGNSRTIGFIGYGLKFYAPSRTFLGIEKEVNQLGYNLFLRLTSRPSEEDIAEHIRIMQAQRVEGIIWAIPEVLEQSDFLLNVLKPLSIPIVCINMEPAPNLVVVAFNNRSGGQIVTRHLISRGRKKICIITGPNTWWESQQRLLGWKDALQEAGRPVDERFIVEGDWSPRSGSRCFEKLYETVPDLDAVVVCNDQMAYGVLHQARKLGLRVPDDLAVTGYDDIVEAEFAYPPLTTVRQEMGKLGEQAVRELDRLIRNRQNGDNQPETKIELLKPELVVRESS